MRFYQQTGHCNAYCCNPLLTEVSNVTNRSFQEQASPINEHMTILLYHGHHVTLLMKLNDHTRRRAWVQGYTETPSNPPFTHSHPHPHPHTLPTQTHHPHTVLPLRQTRGPNPGSLHHRSAEVPHHRNAASLLPGKQLQGCKTEAHVSQSHVDNIHHVLPV